MITSSTLYWITRLDTLCIFFGISFAVLLVSTLIYIIVKLDDFDPEYEADRNNIKCRNKLIILTLICLVPVIFIPSTKEIAFIYFAPKVINNEEAQKIPENIIKFLNVKMNEYIKSNLEEENK